MKQKILAILCALALVLSAVPAAGALLRQEDTEEVQLGLLDGDPQT